MYQTHWSEECDHSLTERRAMTRSDGVVVHVLQCLYCGHKLRNIKKTAWAEPFDEELRNAVRKDLAEHRAEMEAERQRRWAEQAQRAENQRKERALEYQRYLQSDTWSQKRSLVLQRCNHVCEACLKARATQVHHEYYPEEFGTEPLFWLRGICRPCHEQIHNVR